MSTYTTGGGILRACNAAVQAAVPELARISEALAEGLNAAAFSSLATELEDQGLSLQAARETCLKLHSTVPGWAGVLSGGVVADLRRAAQLSAAATQDTTLPGPAATGASQALSRALRAGAAEVSAAQRLLFAETAQLAFRNLGYSVDRAEGNHTTALEARRGHEVMLATFGDGGVAEFDHAGLTETSCLDRQNAVHAEMHRLGVTLQVSTQVDHRDHRGGVAIASAARLGRGSLARGAVNDKETPGRGAPRPLHPGPHRVAPATRRVAG